MSVKSPGCHPFFRPTDDKFVAPRNLSLGFSLGTIIHRTQGKSLLNRLLFCYKKDIKWGNT
jgi:hypothetical protein